MSVETVLAGLGDLTGELEDLYTELHQNPELSMEETETVALIAERLESYGYEVQQIGGGVVGVLTNGDGPTVLFRADIDGLPVTEDTGLPYASTKTVTRPDGQTSGVMHACGHDVHITAGIGAAALLAQAKDAWSGTYIALFQPGEEIAAGAQSMVDDGLVDKVPRPDVALGQHVLPAPAGVVGTKVGPTMSTAASVKVTVHGAGSHGSVPHMSVDPVVLAASIVLRLQTLVSRETDPMAMAVVTVGSLNAGSSANVIPDTAVLQINIRAYDEAVRDALIDGVKRIANAESQASRSPKEPDIEVSAAFPLTDNDEEPTEKVHAAFVGHFGEDRAVTLPALTGSEDFSVIPDAFEVPYTYWGLGGFAADTEPVANHSPQFGPAMQPTLTAGTEAAVVAALAWLGAEAS